MTYLVDYSRDIAALTADSMAAQEH